MFQKVFLRLNRARRFRSIVIALCAIGAIMLVALGPLPLLANPGTVTVRVDPATRAAPVNGTFTVDIVADLGSEMNEYGLGAYEFDLVDALGYTEAITATDAGDLGSTGRTVGALGPNISATESTTVTFGACSYPPDDVDGPKDTVVVLATVELKAKRAGVTTLNLEDALLADTEANAWPDAGADRELNTVEGMVNVMGIVGSADFDGEGATDMTVWRPSTGKWWILTSSSNFTSYFRKQWGYSTDVPVPGDYDGDGTTDMAVWRPSTAKWWILTSSSNFTSYLRKQWGYSTDVPVPGDYDGDGTTDMAVWRPSTGKWWILTSSSDFTSYFRKQWGYSTDVPVPGDYDGDDVTDIAIWRPSTAKWWILTSSSDFTSYLRKQWGYSTDLPVPGDYDGDGTTDIAIWRPSTGKWWILTSSSDFTSYLRKQWGYSTDVPVPGDFDGEGATDIAIWRPSTGKWWILTSSSNFTSYLRKQWGYSTDVPLYGSDTLG
jgi:hypothetical protein